MTDIRLDEETILETGLTWSCITCGRKFSGQMHYFNAWVFCSSACIDQLMTKRSGGP